MMHNFKQLSIWKRSRKLVKDIYLASQGFPAEERYGLSAQIRRAVVSIPSNIAEGCGRGTNPQLIHFLDVSTGSSCELETQLLLAFDLGYLDKEKTDQLTQEVSEIRRMTIAFQNKLR